MGSQDDTASFNLDVYEGSNNVQVLPGYLMMTASLMFFLCVNRLAIKYGLPTKLKCDVWRWQNTFVSWVHANILGLSVIYCFVYQTEMVKDMILYCDWYIYSTISVSCGYFIYDFYDHVINKKVLSNWEVILHHVGVIWTLLYSVHNRINVGYCILALLSEVNSIFLHGRKLLQFIQWPFDHWFYKTVLVFNFVSYIICRGAPVVILSYCAYAERSRLSYIYKIIVAPILVSLYFINGILLWRLFKTDVLRRLKKAPAVKKEKYEMNGNSENGHVYYTSHGHSN